MSMRPGRAADVPALVELWLLEMHAGRRDSVPREPQAQAMFAQFDWGARSRVIEDVAGDVTGAVVVTSRESPEGTVARIDPAVARGDSASPAMRDLVQWGLQLSRAAGAAAGQVWVGPGQGVVLESLGLQMMRPWWRMDRTLAGELPAPMPVDGYKLLDGSSVPKGSWARMHNHSFADHWRFSPRTEEELTNGKLPELCLMAVTAISREPAAVTLCQLESYLEDSRPQPVGLVSSVGTVPGHRRRGLATWLVGEALVRLRNLGARHCSLYVDGLNETRAFDTYRKLGFDLAFEAEVWEATWR
jgi:ribosomal protein S18 acetylase RimI-like enzyme